VIDFYWVNPGYISLIEIQGFSLFFLVVECLNLRNSLIINQIIMDFCFVVAVCSPPRATLPSNGFPDQSRQGPSACPTRPANRRPCGVA
jgi:hypothetical protein